MRGAAALFPAILVLLLTSLPLAQGTRVDTTNPPPAAPGGGATRVAAPIDPTPTPATGSQSPFSALVIDPGHGGDDVGARGANGSEEKALTLAIAKRLKAIVEMKLGIRVMLTRDDDRNVGLDARAAVANNARADAFLSLHMNASPAAGSAGAEVYHLRANRAGDTARRGASEETLVLPVFGEAPRTVKLIRWDSAQARHADTSTALALILAEQLGAHVAMGTHPVRELPLRVLTSVDMPAALIELAYLSNPDEERAVQSDEHQERLAQAVLDAVIQFRSYLEGQGPR